MTKADELWEKYAAEFTDGSESMRKRDFLAALAEYGQAEWQPIETAPKDGTRIIVANDVYGSVWCDVAWRKMIRVPDRWESFIGAVPFRPTHWMPKPDAPAAISREPLP